MKTFLHTLKALAAAAVLCLVMQGAPALAQSTNPTAQSVKEQQLLEALKPGAALSGRVTIPDARSSNLIQPGGQSWRDFRDGSLPTIGAVAVLGMAVVLLLFYLVRGKIRLDSGFSGRTVTRFGGIDRFVHWVTAGCFIVLALSGLNITFGRALLAPLIGEGAFASLTMAGKVAHNYLAFPFMLGTALMFLIWVKDNIPGKIDVEWLKAGGGLFSKGNHPPAPRFNAGQKGIFWIVVIGGAMMSLSGWHLLFPFTNGADVAEQQFMTKIHAIVGMIFIGVMLAHAYIGSVGMEGAFDAMGTGEVDENWAREHHALWLKEQQAKKDAAPAGAVPAE